MRASRLLPGLLVLVVFGAQADFSSGLYAYSVGNYDDAAREFRDCANRGEVQGEYYIGLLYEEGQGVPKDYKTALSWYTKAATKGDVDAAFALGRMYSRGMGVTQDRALAYAWFARAARSGHYLGRQEQQKCASRMSPEQLQAAQRLGMELLIPPEF